MAFTSDADLNQRGGQGVGTPFGPSGVEWGLQFPQYAAFIIGGLSPILGVAGIIDGQILVGSLLLFLVSPAVLLFGAILLQVRRKLRRARSVRHRRDVLGDI